MSSSFYIQNPWTGLVIDIGENVQNPKRGTELRANTKQTSAPGNQYQLWTYIESSQQHPTITGYYFLKNTNLAAPFVIDIEEKKGNIITSSPGGQTLRPGSRLDAYTEKSVQTGDLDDNHPAASNQLWGFVPAGTQGLFFIQNWLTGFVVDIEEGSTGRQPAAGAHLDAYPQKGSDKNKNQLWQFVGPNGAPVAVPAPPAPVPVVGSRVSSASVNR
jgi:hypothetical protein